MDGDMWEGGDYVLDGVGFWFVQTYLTGRYSEASQGNYWMYGVSSYW
jgi:hypothetical protein